MADIPDRYPDAGDCDEAFPREHVYPSVPLAPLDMGLDALIDRLEAISQLREAKIRLDQAQAEYERCSKVLERPVCDKP